MVLPASLDTGIVIFVSKLTDAQGSWFTKINSVCNLNWENTPLECPVGKRMLHLLDW